MFNKISTLVQKKLQSTDCKFTNKIYTESQTRSKSVFFYLLTLLSSFNDKSESLVTSNVYSTANNLEHMNSSVAENPRPTKQVLNTPLSMILSGKQRERSAHFSVAACNGSKFSPHSRFPDAGMVSWE